MSKKTVVLLVIAIAFFVGIIGSLVSYPPTPTLVPTPTPTPIPSPNPPPTPTPMPAPTLSPTISPTATPTWKVSKSVIKAEAEGTVLHYQNESFWDEDQFSRILQNKAEFTFSLIKQFNESLSAYGERSECAFYAFVEFNEVKKSTILKCDVLNAISKSGNSYHATFRWLLRPLGLDFIDSGFQEYEKGLSWEGSVASTPTTITFEFPASIDHCHAHVWWKIMVDGIDAPKKIS